MRPSNHFRGTVLVLNTAFVLSQLARPADAQSVTAGTNGLTIKSSGGDFLLKIGADLQVDSRTFNSDDASSNEQIVLRRVRPTFSGTAYKYVDYFFRPDFGLGTFVIFEAYVQMNYLSRANLRVGKFKPPVGMERLQSDDDTNFIERGLPTLLAPSRDVGIQLSGDIVSRRVNYSAGVFNGAPDNGLGNLDPGNHRDYAGRIFLTPFETGEKRGLRGFGVGVAASGGSVDGIALPSYKTAGQNRFLPLAAGVTSAGHRTRLAPQTRYYRGPFGLLAEYTSVQEGFQKQGSFQKNASRHAITLRSWQVQTTYLLTGESKGFTAVAPRRPFDPRAHAWGAIELAARVGDFGAERGLFDYGFADPAKAARRAHEWMGGANWYLNRLVRLSLDYGNTNFAGGAANGNRPSERVVLARFQLNII
jgi:phosphate-selective porin OprO/OprP